MGLKRAFLALFDRQISTSGGVEFGDYFPLSEIIELARANPAHADPELLRLINRAHGSRYEDPDRGPMTDEEIALFEYIDAEHHRLSARSAPEHVTV